METELLIDGVAGRGDRAAWHGLLAEIRDLPESLWHRVRWADLKADFENVDEAWAFAVKLAFRGQDPSSPYPIPRSAVPR